MKLQEMIDQGYALRGWMLMSIRGERRIAIKLCKKTSRGVRAYVVHAPYPDAGHFKDMEFTAPVLVQ